MPTTLKFKRGNEAAANAFTGAAGELYINTTDFSLRIHDGTTVGGHAVSGGGGDFSAVAQDILPSIDSVYDVGSNTHKWSTVYTAGVDFGGALLTSTSANGIVSISTTSDVVVGSLLSDQLLISDNMITPDATTVNQYTGDKGIVVVNGNLDAQGDWVKLPVAVTTLDAEGANVAPSTLGQEGSVRYNKDSAAAQVYTTSWTDIATSQEVEFLNPYIDMTGGTITARSWQDNPTLPFANQQFYYLKHESAVQPSATEPEASAITANASYRASIGTSGITYYGTAKTSGNCVISAGVPSAFNTTTLNLYDAAANSLISSTIWGEWTSPTIMPIPSSPGNAVIMGVPSAGGRLISYVYSNTNIQTPTSNNISTSTVQSGAGGSAIDPSGVIWTVGYNTSTRNIVLTKMVSPSGFINRPGANTLTYTNYTLDIQTALNSRYTANTALPLLDVRDTVAADGTHVVFTFGMKDQLTDGSGHSQYTTFVVFFVKGTNTFLAPKKVSKGYSFTNSIGKIVKSNPNTSEFLFTVGERYTVDGVEKGMITASLVAAEGGVVVETATAKIDMGEGSLPSLYSIVPDFNAVASDPGRTLLLYLLLGNIMPAVNSVNMYHEKYGDLQIERSVSIPLEGANDIEGMTSWFSGISGEGTTMIYSNNNTLKKAGFFNVGTRNPASYSNKVYVSKPGTSKLYRPGNVITLDITNKIMYGNSGTQRGAIYVDRNGAITPYPGDENSNLLLGYIVGYNRVALA